VSTHHKTFFYAPLIVANTAELYSFLYLSPAVPVLCLHCVCSSSCMLCRGLRPYWTVRTYAWLLANGITGPLATRLLDLAFTFRGLNSV